MEPLTVNARLSLPPDELDVQFAHAGGPGGQNVNKVETKVVMRFSVRESKVLGDARRERLLKRLGSRLTKDGTLVIHASRYRERSRNIEDARERLANMLRDALVDQKRRVATKPTRSSQRRRLDAKQRRSDTKRLRRRPEE